MNKNLAPDQRQANEDAVMAMVSLVGGIEGIIEQGLHLKDFVPLLYADPDDDLSGLRIIAERMTDVPYVHRLEARGASKPEPLVEPAVARSWLLKTKRYRQLEDGSLVLLDEKADHLGIAVLAIASGGESRLLTEAYAEATDNRSPISPDLIKGIAHRMVNDFIEHS